MKQSLVDASAISLSSLCMIHCLALPLVISLLPSALQGLQSEIVHQVFVVLAIPLALSAAWSARTSKAAPLIILALLAGSVALIFGAFVEEFHDHEVALTVFGAISLSIGHILRWVAHAPRQS